MQFIQCIALTVSDATRTISLVDAISLTVGIGLAMVHGRVQTLGSFDMSPTPPSHEFVDPSRTDRVSPARLADERPPCRCRRRATPRCACSARSRRASAKVCASCSKPKSTPSTSSTDLWDFALELRNCVRIGLTNSDLRWLVMKGYVEFGTRDDAARRSDAHRSDRRKV